MSPSGIAQVLRDLPGRGDDPNFLVGTETSDDAGVYRLAEGLALVQTLDFFPPLVDDPFTFGQILRENTDGSDDPLLRDVKLRAPGRQFDGETPAAIQARGAAARVDPVDRGLLRGDRRWQAPVLEARNGAVPRRGEAPQGDRPGARRVTEGAAVGRDSSPGGCVPDDRSRETTDRLRQLRRLSGQDVPFGDRAGPARLAGSRR